MSLTNRLIIRLTCRVEGPCVEGVCRPSVSKYYPDN